MATVQQLPTKECPGYILAGGDSSRFGSDKGLVAIEGQPQLLRLRDQLEEAGHTVSVVADRRSKYETLGLVCLEDVVPGCGPLSGLVSALRHRHKHFGEGWLLLVSCDQFMWSTEWSNQLARGALGHAASVFVPPSVSGDESAKSCDPLPGLFHTQLLASAETRLENRQLALRELLSATSCQFCRCATASPRTWSFNSVEELQELCERSLQ